jgi:thioredoxin 1
LAVTSVSQVTDETFGSAVLASERPVLVDFWAPWCGPCRLVSPVVEELATELEGRIAVVQLNIDENLATSTRYSIFSIPTLVIFKAGVEVERIVGFRRKAELAARLAAHL